MDPFYLANIPERLTWEGVLPTRWVADEHHFYIVSGKEDDWFSDPSGSLTKRNAPVALLPATRDNFILQAKVAVDFQNKYDAGALHVRADEDYWAKLCFERSDDGQPTVVSVVTRGTSDDCNSVPIADPFVYFRVAKIGRAYAFYYGHDGSSWHLVRYFALGSETEVRPGFSSQAPTGEGCAVTFSEIYYRRETIQNVRTGL
jgi:regulation of enolase protein 1 (concanavalin A-like superfamily)